jgi:inorganic pyrophosphatase
MRPGIVSSPTRQFGMPNYINLPAFTEHGDVHVVVETPRGSRAKFAYDRKLATFTLRKSLLTGLTYPHDWGFVPSTKADDDDPLDIMIVRDAATFPGLIVTCRRDIPKPSWFGSVAGGPPFSSHRNFNIPAPLPSTIVQLTARRGDSIG